MAIDFDAELKQLAATMHTIEQVLDLPAMKNEIADLSEQSANPEFWNNQANAQKVNSRLSVLNGDVERFEQLNARVEDLGVLVEMGQEEATPTPSPRPRPSSPG